MFVSAPAEPMTADSFKAALLKLHQSDPATRDLFSSIGLDPAMLRQPDFDLRSFFIGQSLKIAIENALESEEGQELLAKAEGLEPGTEEMGRLHTDLIKRFGPPRLENLLRSMPRVARSPTISGVT